MRNLISSRPRRTSFVAIVCVAFLIGSAGPALANAVTGSYQGYVGGGSSQQFMKWDQPNEKVRLWVDFGGNPNFAGSKCQDAAVDWNVTGDPDWHYDSRVVRNCNPGHFVETDPGGNGYWQEPGDYDEAPVNQVQRAGSYEFPDNNLDNILAHNNAYGGAPPNALPTSHYGQRIRTLYDNNTIQSFDHFPARCNADESWIGLPFSPDGSCV